MKLSTLALPCLVALGLIAAPAPADAWGREGHAITAAIAEAHLSPSARAEVQRLLAVEPGATLESVASWADEIKDRSTSRWHFVNYPKGDCNFHPELECRNGDCLVKAVRTQMAILGDKSLPDAQREVALKWVVHLAGDAAQPLHNWGPDRGGNDYQVQFDGRGTNIHSVWDSGLIRDAASHVRTTHTGTAIDRLMGAMDDRAEEETRADLGGGMSKPNYSAFTAELTQSSSEMQFTPDNDPVDWTESACLVANRPGIYPPRDVPDSYKEQWEPVVEASLIQGGMNLASVLNTILGDGS